MLETTIVSLPQLVNGINATSDNATLFSIELEQDVIGACLMDTACFVKASRILEEYHFCEPVHRFIYGAMRQAYESYKSTSVPLILKARTDEIEDLLKKQNIDFKQYVVRLTVNTVTGHATIEERARAVLSQWGRLMLAARAENIAVAARDPLGNVDELISEAMRTLDEIAVQCRIGRVKGKTCRMIGQVMREALGETKEAMGRKGGLTGISWGLTDLNKLTGGDSKA